MNAIVPKQCLWTDCVTKILWNWIAS